MDKNKLEELIEAARNGDNRVEFSGSWELSNEPMESTGFCRLDIPVELGGRLWELAKRYEVSSIEMLDILVSEAENDQ